ncbi:hypothetical protein ES702_07876 [subsurface metagenome]
MVYFYRDGLEEVLDGKYASDIFTVHQRRGLTRKGIIKRGSHSHYILTPKALVLLDSLREDVTAYFIEAKAYWERDYKK